MMNSTRFMLSISVAACFATAQMAYADAGDDGGECAGGLCGTPDQSGGGCGCGGGSVLIANTDVGKTYQYADDYDNDGFEDDFDNCPFAANEHQLDSDGDGIGDVCDNCGSAANAEQGDVDGDGIGDVCDPDIDNDGVQNADDNCPKVSNRQQNNADGDEQGDACDSDDDNDGINDSDDACPLVSGEDTTAEGCDGDMDGDGRPDSIDNCAEVNNFDQADADGDGIGDVCDSDADNDGVINTEDNCEKVANKDQADADRDGIGDSCDNSFCYQVRAVGSEPAEGDNCLRPETPFQVMSLKSDTVQTGEPLHLHLFANRQNVAIRYTWKITNADGEAVIQNPRGAVTASDSYEYRYQTDQMAQFVAQEPGNYTVQLDAELVWADEQYPNNKVSSQTMTITATGEANGGCAATTPEDAAPIALVGVFFGLGMALRRRRR